MNAKNYFSFDNENQRGKIQKLQLPTVFPKLIALIDKLEDAFLIYIPEYNRVLYYQYI
jgi:hypothetical protein